MNKPAMIKLLRHLTRQRDSKYAARFNMNYFGMQTGGYSMNGTLELPVCKTQACLAGETVLCLKGGFLGRQGGIELYKRYRIEGLDIDSLATRILNLNEAERDRLFFLYSHLGRPGWPKEFDKQYLNAMTPFDRLEVVINRVAHFIDTDGRE